MSICPQCKRNISQYNWKSVKLHGALHLQDLEGAEISCPYCGHVFSVSFFPDWFADLVASRIHGK